MPEFRVLLLKDLDDAEGSRQEWDLPWERLVFDQRIDYQPEGFDKKERFRVLRIEGDLHVLGPDVGTLEGRMPKKVLASPTEE